MGVISPPSKVTEHAIELAARGPCVKSKRAAAVFYVGSPHAISIGVNGPAGMGVDAACGGRCREVCGKIAVHAEIRAIRAALMTLHHYDNAADLSGCELVHVKVVDGQLVAGGGPSCWQCSREIVDVGIEGVWLYELPPDECPIPDCVGDDGCTTPSGPTWRRYTAADFHAETLRACGLEVAQ